MMGWLDGVYWGVQMTFLGLAVVSLIAAIHALTLEWQFLQSVREASPSGGPEVTDRDTYYVVNQRARAFAYLGPPALFLFFGGALHWLRRIYQARKETP